MRECDCVHVLGVLHLSLSLSSVPGRLAGCVVYWHGWRMVEWRWIIGHMKDTMAATALR